MRSRSASGNRQERCGGWIVAVGLSLLAVGCSVGSVLDGTSGSGSGDAVRAASDRLTEGSGSAGGETGERPRPDRSGEPPEVRELECPFDTSEVTEVDCGRVTMPGRGDDPDFEVEIAFARFRATGPPAERHPDPVVYLHGGPGAEILAEAAWQYRSVVAPFIETRDVILYDQRGAGASSPLPACPTVEGATLAASFEVSAIDDQVADVADALARCADRRFESGDVDPTAFSTIVNVQDLLDLLWALDIDEYNLHGSSYGSRLAQAVMRDAPEGVRSVVLAGVYPTDISPFNHIPATLEIALDAVFAGCEADEVCHAALPDPWASLEALVADLDRDPEWVADAPGRGKSTPQVFDGNQFLNGLQGLLYTREGAAMIPDLLLDAEDGDRRRLRRLADTFYGYNAGLMAGLLVVCADEVPFPADDGGIAPPARSSVAVLDDAAGLLGPHVPTYCEALGVEWTAGRQNDPVTWDVPTLIFSGAADPITPVVWARRLAERLPRSRLIVDPLATHDAGTDWCATGLLRDFVELPERLVDVSCFRPGNHLAVNDAAVRFAEESEPFTAEIELEGLESIEVLVPGWDIAWVDTAYLRWRNLDTLDPTAFAIIGPEETVDATDLLGGESFATSWVPGSSDLTPSGWERSVRLGPQSRMIRYVHRSSGLTLVVMVEIGDPDDIEAGVLAPAARSIQGLP